MNRALNVLTYLAKEVEHTNPLDPSAFEDYERRAIRQIDYAEALWDVYKTVVVADARASSAYRSLDALYATRAREQATNIDRHKASLAPIGENKPANVVVDDFRE